MTPRLPAAARPVLLAGAGLVLVASACGLTDGENTGVAPSAFVPDTGTPGSRRPLTNPTIRLPRSPTTFASPGGSLPPLTLSDYSVDPLEACPAGASETTTVARYRTTGADRIVFVVDDVQLPDVPALTGSHRITLPCDTAQHYVMILAVSPTNATADDTRILFGRGTAAGPSSAPAPPDTTAHGT